MFMFCSGLLEKGSGKTLAESFGILKAIWEDMKGEAWEVQKGQVQFWTPISILNYSLVPKRFRLFFISCANILWMVWLIVKTNRP